jgi:hypothetical protein
VKLLYKGIVIALFGTATVSVFGMAPAAAHGQCGANSGVPSWNGNISGGEWTWISSGACTSSHPDTYMRTCLQESATAGLTGWSDAQIASPCKEQSWSSSLTTFVLPVTKSGGCKAGYWYRTYTVFSSGNGGAHWGIYAYSPAVLPCTP